MICYEPDEMVNINEVIMVRSKLIEVLVSTDGI